MRSRSVESPDTEYFSCHCESLLVDFGNTQTAPAQVIAGSRFRVTWLKSVVSDTVFRRIYMPDA